MKKIALLLTLFFGSLIASAQDANYDQEGVIYSTDDIVTVGRPTPSGSYGGNTSVLELVNTDGGFLTIGRESSTTGKINIGSTEYGNKLYFGDNTDFRFSAGGDIMTIKGSDFGGGRVGIGTASPEKKLDIRGDVKLKNYSIISDGNSRIDFGHTGIGNENTDIGVYIENDGELEVKRGTKHGLTVSNHVNLARTSGVNVSIGSNASGSNPVNKLHIIGLGELDGINLDNRFKIRRSSGSNNVNTIVMEHTLDGGKLFLRSMDGDDTSGDLIINDLGGNVGIGTGSPGAKLSVIGQNAEFFSNTGSNTFRVGRDDVQNLKFHVTDTHGYIDYEQDADENSAHVLWIRNKSGGTNADNDIRLNTNNLDRLTVKRNGNVGIGTTTPGRKLEVNGDILLKNSTSKKCIYTWNPTDENWRIGMNANPGFTRSLSTSHVQYLTYGGGAGKGFAVGVNGGNSSFEIQGSDHSAFFRGSVGIGTTDTYGSKLAVDGSILCEEVKVQADISVPDYVFEDDYNLKTLEEVDTYIQANHHLPNVPSAQEIEDNGGFGLAEMNLKLLEKVEELTLYLIEMKKENAQISQAQAKRIEALEQALLTTQK